MNLQKFFDTQKVLRDRIGYNGEDRFEKLILALLVEIGECANEWRGFKFWSKDQEPRTHKTVRCHACGGTGGFFIQTEKKEDCTYCDGTGIKKKAIHSLKNMWTDCILFWKLDWKSMT